MYYLRETIFFFQACYMFFRIERTLAESVTLTPLLEDTKYTGEKILPLFQVDLDSFELQKNSTELKFFTARGHVFLSIQLISFGLCFGGRLTFFSTCQLHEFQTDQSHKKAFTFVVKSSIFVENGSFNSLCAYMQ